MDEYEDKFEDCLDKYEPIIDNPYLVKVEEFKSTPIYSNKKFI